MYGLTHLKTAVLSAMAFGLLAAGQTSTSDAITACSSAGFLGDCIQIPFTSGACTNVPASFNDLTVSLSTPAANCTLFRDFNCRGPTLLIPGQADFHDLTPWDFDRRLSSFNCTDF